MFHRQLAAARAHIHDLNADVMSSCRNSLTSRYDVLWLTLVTLLAVAVRAYSLRQPVSYDEAYTFLNFVNRGVGDLFRYPVPNNHVFHTLLVRVFTLLFGRYPIAMRTPAFLAGVATIPAAFCLCRSLVPARSGYLASAALAVFPYMVLYSTMARGYSLIALFTLILALVGHQAVRKLSWPACAVLSIIGALGMWTIPTMLYALGGIYVWLAAVVLVQRRSLRVAIVELLLPCVIMTALFTSILYVPTVMKSGVHQLVGNHFVQPLPWREFVDGLVSHRRDVSRQFSWALPDWFPVACVILAIVGIAASVYGRNWPAALFMPGLIAGSIVILIGKQSVPFVRTWIYLIPVVMVAADVGLAYAMRHVHRTMPVAVSALLLVFAGAQGVSLVSDNAIAKGADFPDGSRLVQALRSVMNHGDIVHVVLPVDWPTYFYMWYYDVPDSTRVSRQTQHEFFVVDKRSYKVADLTAQPVTLVAEFGDAALYTLADDRH